jgi:hypothetical protein
MWKIWKGQSFQMTRLRLSLPTYLLGIVGHCANATEVNS